MFLSDNEGKCYPQWLKWERKDKPGCQHCACLMKGLLSPSTHNSCPAGGDKRGQNYSSCYPFSQIPSHQIMPMKLAECYGNPTFEKELEAVQMVYECDLAYSWAVKFLWPLPLSKWPETSSSLQLREHSKAQSREKHHLYFGSFWIWPTRVCIIKKQKNKKPTKPTGDSEVQSDLRPTAQELFTEFRPSGHQGLSAGQLQLLPN